MLRVLYLEPLLPSWRRGFLFITPISTGISEGGFFPFIKISFPDPEIVVS
jgi:hypothetical protein